MDSHAAFALCGGESDSILRRDGMRCPIATVLKLPVEVVQQVTHEFMSILLLIASVHTNTALNEIGVIT